jgi:hypothetical protein
MKLLINCFLTLMLVINISSCSHFTYGKSAECKNAGQSKCNNAAQYKSSKSDCTKCIKDGKKCVKAQSCSKCKDGKKCDKCLKKKTCTKCQKRKACKKYEKTDKQI